MSDPVLELRAAERAELERLRVEVVKLRRFGRQVVIYEWNRQDDPKGPAGGAAAFERALGYPVGPWAELARLVR